MRQTFPRLLIALCAAQLAGCAVGPDFAAPTAQAPAAWHGADPTVGVTDAAADDGAWWTGFHDPEMTSLISRAAAENLDAKAAVLRIAQARAQHDMAVAGFLPTLGADASAQVTRLSQSTPTGALFSKVGKVPGFSAVQIPNPYTQEQLGFDASWEVDLFGRVRRAVEAARADTDASIEDGRAVLITVQGEVAKAYLDLRGAQAKRRLLEETAATDKALLQLADQREQAGWSGRIDVVRAGAEASAAQAQLPALDRQIAADINQLSLLIAREPGALAAELAPAQPMPPIPPRVPVGLPADLARRRPDIRAAEARLHAATARIGVAMADLYPKLTLSGQAGYQAQTLPMLTNWASRFFTAGPAVQLPIFEGGRLRAAVRLQDAQAQAAALTYRGAVLSALHEVDNALIAYAADQAREASLDQTVAQNTEAADLARQRYASGLGGYVDVLQAERTGQQNAVLAADARTATGVNLVAIYKALGGGWRAE